jgi:glutathione S-transferase
MAITFYWAPRSSATRIYWALEELEIPHEKVRIDFSSGDQKKPEYVALNPNGKVPLLVDGGVAIFESLAQLLHLGETYGVDKGLFPKAGLERAEAFKWMCWGSASLLEALSRVIHNGERVAEELRNPKAREAALRDAAACFAILDAHLAGKEHVLPGGFSLVDASLASLVPFATRLGVDTGALPNLQPWVGRCVTRPALARAMQG